MNKLSSTILATALVGVVSITAFATTANAANNQRQGHGARGAGPVHFVCNDQAETRIETGLGRMAEHLELTDDQTTSFETFKTAALAAQAGFSEVCAELKPVARGQANSDMDLIDRLNNRQAMMSAQLDAMADVLPEFEAFYDSLTDEQKQSMRPRRGGQHSHGPNGNNGQHSHGNNGGQGPKGPNAPANG